MRASCAVSYCIFPRLFSLVKTPGRRFSSLTTATIIKPPCNVVKVVILLLTTGRNRPYPHCVRGVVAFRDNRAMSATRPLPAAVLLLASAIGCAGNIKISHTFTEDGFDERTAIIQHYSSASRDEALKLIAQECPNGFDITAEGPNVVAGTTLAHQRGFAYYRPSHHEDYRIYFRERNPELTSSPIPKLDTDEVVKDLDVQLSQWLPSATDPPTRGMEADTNEVLKDVEVQFSHWLPPSPEPPTPGTDDVLKSTDFSALLPQIIYSPLPHPRPIPKSGPSLEPR
jgi:hypothetical protein